jgi:hypothetical protein
VYTSPFDGLWSATRASVARNASSSASCGGFSPTGDELFLFCAWRGRVVAVSTDTWTELRGTDLDPSVEARDAMALAGYTPDEQWLVGIGGAFFHGGGGVLHWIDPRRSFARTDHEEIRLVVVVECEPGTLPLTLPPAQPGRLLTRRLVVVEDAVLDDQDVVGLVEHHPGPGRHPLAGLAAAFAGVSAGFSANLLITSLDPLLAGLSQEAARLIDPDYVVHSTANY